MSKIIVKDNRLVEANYRLSLNEQRLILLACSKLTKNTEYGDIISVSASDYADQFNVDSDTAYTLLKSANETLFKRYLTFIEFDKAGHETVFKMRWCDNIGYKKVGGILHLRFTKEVFPLVCQLEKNFTKIELDAVKNFTSVYAYRLYEVLMKWRTVGHTPVIAVEDLRKIFGIDSKQYRIMSDFKKKVLDFAVTQIQQLSDIELYNPSDKNSEYAQIKAGRKIEAFQFYFRKKNSKVSDNTKSDSKVNFVKMTERQRLSFASKLSKLPELAHLATGLAGQSYEAFAQQIAEELKDAEKQKKYVSSLEKLGFKQNNQR